MSGSFPIARGLALLLITVASGCGGGQADEALTVSTTVRYAAPLFDDEGHPAPSDPAATPATIATHMQRYASRSQAERFKDALGERAIPLHLARDDAGAVDRVIAAHRALPEDPSRPTVVLVSADDVRIAAAVVDRMHAAGLQNVWLVTP